MGEVTLSDIVEGESYTISGEAKGGVAGFAKGGAQVKLSDADGGGTELHYDVEAKVGGKLAQTGFTAGRQFRDQRWPISFFERFQEHVERPGADA